MTSNDQINELKLTFISISHRECRVNDNEVSALVQITNKFNFTDLSRYRNWDRRAFGLFWHHNDIFVISTNIYGAYFWPQRGTPL